MHTAKRLLQFVVGVTTCALLTGLTALFVLLYALPPNDTAHGQGLLATLRDPFVFIVWLTKSLGAALIALPIAIWALWRVQLVKAILVVTLASVVGGAIGGLTYAPLSPLIALLTGSVAMVWCRYHTPWRIPAPSAGAASTAPVTSDPAARR